ncbi:MAG: nucleotidyltransferase family protein [Lachnospiraceae bacterium]|nr:nucleotidyltransferase family protein [Lachnospiraceae bacterium]
MTKTENMNVTGIIAEFNPLHKGHKYILDRARSDAGADCVIVVMSGDFTQRGDPAFCDKHLRALMALKAGADIVIELPVKAATSSAEFFASSGVFLLEATGVVTDMIFGVESNDRDALSKISEVLAAEPESYRSNLKDELKKGRSYPTARQTALLNILPKLHDLSIIMSSPNNILAIEYLKSLKRLDSKIQPHFVSRLGAGYHDNLISPVTSSALAIRSAMIERDDIEPLRNELPESTYEILANEYKKLLPILASDLSSMLKYRLVNAIYDKEDLTRYAGVSKNMADRIARKAISFIDTDDLIQLVKSKDLTYARISRALLHILLGIKAPEETLDASNSYLRILGFREEASPVIKKIRENALVPVISRPSDAKDILAGSALDMFNDTLRASEIYNKLAEEKYNAVPVNDLSRKAEKTDGICIC